MRGARGRAACLSPTYERGLFTMFKKMYLSFSVLSDASLRNIMRDCRKRLGREVFTPSHRPLSVALRAAEAVLSTRRAHRPSVWDV